MTQRYVANLLAQYYPGRSLYTCDSSAKRLEWFRGCLKELARHPLLQNPSHSIAFPYNIGCGLAGGRWTDYEAELKGFAQAIEAKVVLVKLT